MFTIIEGELKNDCRILKSAILTENWLLPETGSDIVPLRLIVWGYIRINIENKTVLSYDTIAIDRDGSEILLCNSPKESESVSALTELYRAAPWIMLGYDDNTVEFWENQSSSFVTLVESRIPVKKKHYPLVI
jgi:hypothetical protein